MLPLLRLLFSLLIFYFKQDFLLTKSKKKKKEEEQLHPYTQFGVPTPLDLWKHLFFFFFEAPLLDHHNIYINIIAHYLHYKFIVVVFMLFRKNHTVNSVL